MWEGVELTVTFEEIINLPGGLGPVGAESCVSKSHESPRVEFGKGVELTVTFEKVINLPWWARPCGR